MLFIPSQCIHFNSFVTYGLAYNAGESIFILRGIRSDIKLQFQFLMKYLYANRIASAGMLRFATSGSILFA